MDVDGTLTDGSLIVLPDGEELKSYNVRDGMGILLAGEAGIKTGIITGKTSSALIKRAARLKIDEIHQGAMDKKRILFMILKKYSFSKDEIAFIGDDLGDLEVLKTVGFSGAVSDAHPEVIQHSQFVSLYPGGKGAVREFIEFILKAQDKWSMIQDKLKLLSIGKGQE